jgi:23S rRNA (cytosine1962-C5)-methyltransferase
MQEETRSRPTVTISRRGADRVRAGHPWVYRSDVVAATNVYPGALVNVREAKGAKGGATTAGAGRHGQHSILGSAFYSTASEIAVRMVSPKAVEDLDQLVRERIRAAAAYRERFVRDTNAYRVVFSEGDFLPGLIVDRYNDILSFQVLTQAMDDPRVREVFLLELRDRLNPVAIVERVDPRVRRLEQLPEKGSHLTWERTAGTIDGAVAGPDSSSDDRSSAAKIMTEFQMNGVRFLLDALGGQKTGAFLDQRENYRAAAEYARGEALDVFCYQGGFALHLAGRCEKVTGVDSSRPALEMAERNAGLNGREIDWIEANAFDLLRDYVAAGREYDTVVVDPPAFAKSRSHLGPALGAYKELNLRALKMLKGGGLLVTCSCSYHVGRTDFLEVTLAAAQDSHRILRILDNRGQAKDHPTQLGIPETAYLKCVIAVVS